MQKWYLKEEFKFFTNWLSIHFLICHLFYHQCRTLGPCCGKALLIHPESSPLGVICACWRRAPSKPSGWRWFICSRGVFGVEANGEGKWISELVDKANWVCLGLSVCQLEKDGTVKGLNPSVGVPDGNVSTCGSFMIICIVWMKMSQKGYQCCRVKTCY